MRDDRSPRRYHDEESSYGSGASSTLSSFSGSGSTWSLPRSRAIPNASRRSNNAEGPRRSGSSFRVSLRPTRQRHSRSGNSRGSRDTDSENGVSCDDPRYATLVRKVLIVLVGFTLIGGAFHLLRPPAATLNSLYIVNDKLSTEDKVAQSEMSAKAGEEVFRSSLRTQQPTMIKANVDSIKEARAFLEGAGEDTAAALKGSSLKIVDSEDRLPPKNDLNMNLDAYNASAPTRVDWSPSIQNRTDGDNQTIVAYVLPVYTCYKLSGQALVQHGINDPSNDREFLDSALMLQASIHKSSVRTPSSGSSYNYEMVALVHHGVESCAGGANRSAILERLGYRVEVVREPIHANNIKDDYLQKHAPRNNGGRAGMREMIRLYAFKMIDYRIAVLVDSTTFMLHPPDAIFDALLNGPRGHEWAEAHPNHIIRDTFYANGTIVTAKVLPTALDIMFTRDYSAMSANSWTTGISLAFVPIRPSLQIFRKLINKYQSTSYDAKFGWDGKGYSHYAGSMQTKGLLTYFFSEIEPHRKLELQRCIYNNLADVPFIAGKQGVSDSCRDVKEHKTLPDGSIMPCTDCRIQLYDEIVVANFAICQSPWVCPYIEGGERVPLLAPTLKMCRQFHESWFKLRKSMEDSVLEASKRSKATGTFHQEVFHGYCQPGGERGGAYVTLDYTLQLPNGFGNAAF
jgi:hypothetical protein